MMKRPFLLCFLIFCGAMGALHGQPAPGLRYFSETNADIQAWEAARQSMVLLRNEGPLLPLQQLGKRSFNWQTFGLGTHTIFKKTLNNYQPASPPPIIGNADNVLVIAINGDSIKQLETEDTLSSLPENVNLIAVLFGDAHRFGNLPLLEKADAILFVPFADSLHQSLAAQAIFGGCAINGHASTGQVQADFPPIFLRNDGLETQQTRLGYAPPALVRLDGEFMADSIRTIVEEGIRAQAFPGAQVLVAKGGKVIFYETYGFQTYDSIQPVRPDDLYDFASVTKVTSTLPALMKLYGEGKFNLDAPLKEYLPFFKNSDKADVTYRQLLAHHGRLKPTIVFWSQAKNEDGTWKKRSFKDHYSRRYPIQVADSLFLFKNYKKQIYKGIRDLPLNEKPGYVYSDLSFILYPKVVEKLTGEPLEDYLKNTFYQPLGATTLTYNPLRYFPKERIEPTERDTFFRRQQLQGTVHDETAAMLGGVSGHAGLFGTANDLAKLLQMYLNLGVYGGARFINETAVKEFTRCQYCWEGNRRALGFDRPLIDFDPVKSYVAKSASPESYGHSGYTGTFFWVDPKYDLIVIFLCNRVYPYRSHTGISDLNIRPRVQQVVYDAMR